MKREIKYRAWNHIVNRMTDCYTLEELHKEKILFNNLIFMQYTGLLDKNGVEIYEGDIVEVDYNYRQRPYLDKLLCKFSNGAFNFFYKGIERVVNVDTTVYKTIGNIHENPELL